MSKWHGIAFKLNLFLIGLLLLACAGVIAVGGYTSREAFEIHMNNVTFPAKVDGVVVAVERELVSPVASLVAIAQNPFFIEWIKNGEDQRLTPLLFSMSRTIRDKHQTSTVNVVLRDSMRYYGLTGAEESVFITTKERDPWFLNFEASGDAVWVNIHPANDPVYPNMAFINQRIEHEGRFLGNISTGMKVGAFAERLINMTTGTLGSTFMLRADGTIMIHKNPELIGKNVSVLPGYAEHSADISRKMNENKYRFSYYNADGDKILVDVRAMSTLGTILVCEANMMEMLSGLKLALLYSTGIGCFIVLVGVGLCLMLTSRLTRPLRDTIALAQEVGKGHKLDDASRIARQSRLAESRKDEIGTLAVALHSMMNSLDMSVEEARAESLRAHEESQRAMEAKREADESRRAAEEKSRSLLDASHRLNDIAVVVSNASQSLVERIQDSKHGSREQAGRVTETASAVEAMNETALHVAGNAATASQVSLATRQKALEGAAIVRKVVDGIRQVSQQSLKLKTDMGALDQNANAINQIMGVISDIADQTNLLALNAAIEAARAGEAGRGFAVVAEEVRKLAEKTMASTADVAKAIQAIQDSVAKSVEQTDLSVQAIDEATGHAARSGEALEEIVSMMDDTAEQVKAIASALDQQSSTTASISVSIAQVDAIAGKTALSMNEAAQAVGELTSQAGVLTELIGRMRN